MSWLELATPLFDTARATTGLAANWLIQSTLLVGGGLILGYLLRHRGSAVQSAIYRTTLVAVLVCPLATWGLSLAGISGWSLQMPEAYEHESITAESPVDVSPLIESPVVETAVPSKDFQSKFDSLQSVDEPRAAFELASSQVAQSEELIRDAPPAPSLVDDTVQPDATQTLAPLEVPLFRVQGFGFVAAAAGALWFGAGGLLLLRLGLAWWRLHRLRHSAWAAEPSTREICHQLAALLDVSPPDVLHSPYLPSPCLAGLRRPAVLLPEAEMSLPVRDVLVHELAHLRRHDCWWNLLRRVATAVLFFQPLLWKLSRRLDSTAEEVCDDFVVQLGGDRLQYAHRLVDIAELSLAPAAAAGVGIVSLRSMLATRVARIMDTSRSLSTGAGRLLLAMVLLAGLAATLLVGLVGIQPNHAAAETTTQSADAKETDAEESRSTADVEPAEADIDDLVTVRGRVIGPNENAVPGANVYALRWFWNFGERKPLAQVEADSDGRFEISYSKSQFFEAGRPEQWREAFITAFADGFGPAWITYGELNPGEEPTLRLVRDDVPIEGRIVDLEGLLVAGATIEMGSFNASKKEDLSDWLEAVRAGQSISTAFKHLGEMMPASSAKRWQGIITDADGRFRMTGIGRERQVRIHVKHPSIVTQTLSVVTREMEPLSQPAYDSPRSHDEINYGARFEHAAAPSRPIEGVIRDAKTREPIAGVEVWSSRFAGENISGVATIKTKTDGEGRYRLEGMPKGEGNEIYAVPTELPYFTARFEVPNPPGIEAAELDIELHRGQWITGRVTDKETGRGVSARMYYIATPDNPIAPTLPEIADATHIIRVQDRYRTSPDGSYRVVGLPGRGIVAVGVIQGAYRGGQGYQSISDRDNRDGYMKFNSALSPGEKFPTAVKEIQVAESNDDTVCDFVLDPGQKVTLRVVDAAGMPVTGVEAQGIREVHDSLQSMEDATIEIIAMRENEARTVLLHHEERGLGKALRVKASDGEAGPIMVRLERLAAVTGRLVDGDGEPVRGVHLRIDVRGDGGYGKNLPGTATDSEGRFQHDAFLPGLAYNINAEGARIEFATVARDLEVQPGEAIDLGTIDITSDERPEPKRIAANLAQNAEGAKAKRLDNDVVDASGRVLAPDGKPATGAEVLFAPRYATTEADLKVRATTDENGHFTFTFQRSDLARLAEGLRPPWSSPYIVARMTGSGAVRKHIVEPADAKDVTLQLVADDVPIEGRIVDLEGQPVANAALRILRVEGNPNGSLDAWLQGLRDFGEFWNSSDTWLQDSISQDVSGLPAEVRTDADGRFTLRGMGRERVVDLRLEAPRLESTEISVMSRDDGAITVPLEKENPELGTYILYNSTFTHSAAPSQPVEGIVRDADNGEPIAGVTLYCEKRAGRSIHGRYAPETKTDERGRYVLNGLPKGADNEIAVVPPAGTPYVPQNLGIDTSQGLETKTVDVELRAAALIRGRVTDETTGNPAANARVEYFAAITNESIETYPGFRDADDITTTTDADGRYEIVGLPGRGFLAIRAASDEFAAGQMIDVNEGDYDNPGRLRDTMFRTHPHTCIADQHHVVVAVEVAAAKADVARDVALGRGVARQARIIDPDDNSLAGVEVNRRGIYACEWYGGDVTLDDAEFTVYGLDPDKPRSLFLKHSARGLVGAFVVTADAKEPIEMRLQPAGSLAGRVVDEDGKPVRHTTLHGRLADGQGEVDGFFFRTSTDDAGCFRAAQLVPGLKYQLRYHRSEREYVPLKSKLATSAEITVTSGQVLELGDVGAVDPPAASASSAQNAAPKPAAAESIDATAAKVDESATGSVRIRGRVMGADGKPAAGAHVAVVAASVRQQRGGDLGQRDEFLAEASADADGRYELKLNGVSSKTHRYAVLIARSDGSALAWHRLNLDETEADVSLQLVAEKPIRGRLVDIEGRPAGGARMSYRAVMPTMEDRRAQDGVGFREFNAPPAAWPQPVTTDDDGHFVLPGIAAGQGVWLTLEANDRFAPQDISLNTGLPEQRGASDGTYRSQVVRTLKPDEEPVLALAPAQIFEGVVTYEDTGEPAPRARLTVWASQQKLGSMYSVPGKADAQGRYRLHPYPGIRFGITAYPPDGAPYLTRELPAIDWEDAETVRKADVKLPRGVLVRGTITDARTGRPVTEATIQYVPEEENNPNDADDILTGWQGIQLSNEKGEFEIVVLLGRGSLLVHGPEGEFILEESSSLQLSRGTPGGQRRYAQAFQRIEPQAANDVIDLKIELQPAKKISGRIVDESGAPVDKALMITRLHITPSSPYWRGFAVELLGGRFELGGLAPGEEYPTHFLDAKRRLGVTVNLKASDAEPTVMLKPCGEATARFVDPDGQPLDGFSPMLEMIVASGVHQHDFEAMRRGELAADSDYVSNIDRTNHWSGPPTDDEGRITFPALIPGATYRIGRFNDGNWSIAKDFSVSSSESLDLSDIVMRLEN